MGQRSNRPHISIHRRSLRSLSPHTLKLALSSPGKKRLELSTSSFIYSGQICTVAPPPPTPPPCPLPPPASTPSLTSPPTPLPPPPPRPPPLSLSLLCLSFLLSRPPNLTSTPSLLLLAKQKRKRVKNKLGQHSLHTINLVITKQVHN